MEWNPLPYFLNKNIGHASDIQKPASFDEMQSAVTKLAEGFEFVRIDFYEIEETPIFGEYTFTPSVDALSEKCRSLLFNRLTSEK